MSIRSAKRYINPLDPETKLFVSQNDFGRINRIFMEGDRVRFRSRARAEGIWDWFKKAGNAIVSGVKSVGKAVVTVAKKVGTAVVGAAKAVASVFKDFKNAVTDENEFGLGNDIRYLSAIFLCSEQVHVTGQHLVYNGTIFLRYDLDKNLFYKPEMKQEHSATEKMSSPFEERFNMERDATEDVNARFVVGFGFEISVHKNDGAMSPDTMKKIYDEGIGLKTPEKWSQDKKDKGAW